jgi:hypothetical protein
MKTIVLFDQGDINFDGSATVWWMRKGADLNEEFVCSSLYGMLTSKELFSLIFRFDEIEIDDFIFHKWCKKRRPTNGLYERADI